jgi:hypothetical protein
VKINEHKHGPAATAYSPRNYHLKRHVWSSSMFSASLIKLLNGIISDLNCV